MTISLILLHEWDCWSRRKGEGWKETAEHWQGPRTWSGLNRNCKSQRLQYGKNPAWLFPSRTFWVYYGCWQSCFSILILPSFTTIIVTSRILLGKLLVVLVVLISIWLTTITTSTEVWVTTATSTKSSTTSTRLSTTIVLRSKVNSNRSTFKSKSDVSDGRSSSVVLTLSRSSLSEQLQLLLLLRSERIQIHDYDWCLDLSQRPMLSESSVLSTFLSLLLPRQFHAPRNLNGGCHRWYAMLGHFHCQLLVTTFPDPLYTRRRVLWLTFVPYWWFKGLCRVMIEDG